MNLYDFVRETRSCLIEKKGYEKGHQLVGIYACTIMQTHGFATPEAIAEHIIAIEDAPDAAAAVEIIKNFVFVGAD